MICSKCGVKISNDSKFCYNCGHNITNENSKLKNDELDIQPTENNVAENSTSNNNVTKVESVYNQSTKQQNYHDQNSKQPAKTNKNNVINTLIIVFIVISFGGIILFLIFTLLFGKSFSTNTYTDTTTEIIEDTNLTNIYTNKEDNIYFNYPEDWKIVSVSSDEFEVIVALATIVDIDSLTNMHIVRTETSKYTNYFNNKDSVPELYAMDGSEVIEVIDTKIDGVDAVKVTSNTPDNCIGMQYFYNFNDSGYMITFTSTIEEFDEYQPIFDSIMESYKFTSSTEDLTQTEDSAQIENPTQTEDITQNQIYENDGLTEADALAEVQKFSNTYPLLELKITGYVDYKPQVDTLSTKGVYSIEVVAPDGSHYSLLIDKMTGTVFLSSDGSSIIDGEELYKKLYDELLISNQNDNVILFNGKKVAKYIGTSLSSVYGDFGPIIHDTDIKGLISVPTLMINYKNIGFIYNTDLMIELIIGNPEFFTYKGNTLNKNRNELAKLLGEPVIDFRAYSDMYGADVYCIEYPMDNYVLRFTFKTEDGNACLISFIQ